MQTAAGYSAASSVARLARIELKSLGQGSRPARSMIRSIWVRRFALGSRYPDTTNSAPFSASSKASSSTAWSSGKSGMMRSDFPMCLSVFGDLTRSRRFAQSTSAQRTSKTSEGHLSPPKRASAMMHRQSAFGAASISLLVDS
ncbi:MAG: hypothetical protein JJ974_11400 [Phycisphaerales bacterium]|nr:hypothetical protein [Phycisphaerales bacterium]